MTDPLRMILRLCHDFNQPRNAGGFYEVVLDRATERNVYRGDEVLLVDDGIEMRGRVRCLVAVVEATDD